MAWLFTTKWGQLVLLVLGVLTGGLLLKTKWVREGKEKARVEQLEDVVQAHKERADVEEAVRRIDADERRKRLHDEWSR